MTKRGVEITVGEFIEGLNKYHPDQKMFFGGLDFCQFRDIGDHIMVEFNQSVHVDEAGRVTVTNHILPE